MNKVRRKELHNISMFASNIFNDINKKTNKIDIMTSIQKIVNDLEDIKSDEEYYMYNIPENMQGGSRYADAEEACDNIEMAISYLTNLIEDEQCTMNEIADTLAYSITYIDQAAI